jgi:hypothetical protein
MDAFAKRMADQIKERYTEEDDRLRVANKILGQLIVSTHIQKVHGGGLAELEACKTINLTWISKKAHGCDAVDQNGLHAELKCTGVKKRRGKEAVKTNINYKFPQNVDVYQHYATSSEYAGGHYFVVMNRKKTKVRWWVKVSQQALADCMKQQMKKNPGKVHINLGGSICKRCDRGCKRWDEITGETHSCTIPIKLPTK